MGDALTDWLPLETIESLLAMPFGEVWLALGFLALTASVYASGIPGTLVPISFSSGFVLGGALGMLAVGTGAMIGAVALYIMLERGSRAALQDRFRKHLDRLESIADKGGLLPLIALRIAGVPHLAVTALCALAAIGPRRYAAATAIGIVPAIALAATAGAAL